MYQAFECSLMWLLAGMEMRGPTADHVWMYMDPARLQRL
jgi:hypothetical protein